MKLVTCIVICVFGSALGRLDPILRKTNPDGLRYQYTLGPNGVPHLVDTWQTLTDLSKLAKYNPDNENQYHLFTRMNPTVSQPLVIGNFDVLARTNFNPITRTVFLIHGWGGHALTQFNLAMIPAVLASADVNLIVVDWAQGSVLGIDATVASGRSVAGFVSWLKNVTGLPAQVYHLIGFSMGAQHAGITGRYVDGGVGHITALDPAAGWEDSEHIFHKDDGLYTEAIWTNAGVVAHLGTLAHVDFFPNGGTNMPGCGGNPECSHDRSFFYLAESIVSGGFTGVECESLEHARIGDCDLPGRLNMGSRSPNVGATGIYYLQTNAGPPFSMD